MLGLRRRLLSKQRQVQGAQRGRAAVSPLSASAEGATLAERNRLPVYGGELRRGGPGLLPHWTCLTSRIRFETSPSWVLQYHLENHPDKLCMAI